MAYTLSEIYPDDKRGQRKLRALLEGEGIPFTADGRVDMARCAWEIPPQEVHHG